MRYPLLMSSNGTYGENRRLLTVLAEPGTLGSDVGTGCIGRLLDVPPAKRRERTLETNDRTSAYARDGAEVRNGSPADFGSQQQPLFDIPDREPLPRDTLALSKTALLQRLSELMSAETPAAFKNKAYALREWIVQRSAKNGDLFLPMNPDDAVNLRRDTLVSEIDQMLDAFTLDRAKYYLHRLESGLVKMRTSAINDINLLRWKEYDDIVTDSLWIIDRRDTSGAHAGWYWGNFVPQIPQQMMRRYTKKGEWVLDTFTGSGTTLIECRRLGRNGVGIELNEHVAEAAKRLVTAEPNPQGITSKVVVADSRTADIGALLAQHGQRWIQLLIMHPPYHDIIEFSDDARDLSNAESTEAFLRMFGQVVDNATPWLETGRFLAVVIGDKYAKGEWIPLGFYCMSEIMKRGYLLKSIVVKNFDTTRAKRSQEQLWRYRALVGGFFIFKHEYVLVFQKQ
ncbi:MAG: site-specific DNA-methyltransferase [Chloroflexi bacterium]|nr:site-specific DNA-methyltransferase [Chloroflexota bacterium]